MFGAGFEMLAVSGRFGTPWLNSKPPLSIRHRPGSGCNAACSIESGEDGLLLSDATLAASALLRLIVQVSC